MFQSKKPFRGITNESTTSMRAMCVELRVYDQLDTVEKTQCSTSLLLVYNASAPPISVAEYGLINCL